MLKFRKLRDDILRRICVKNRHVKGHIDQNTGHTGLSNLVEQRQIGDGLDLCTGVKDHRCVGRGGRRENGQVVLNCDAVILCQYADGDILGTVIVGYVLEKCAREQDKQNDNAEQHFFKERKLLLFQMKSPVRNMLCASIVYIRIDGVASVFLRRFSVLNGALWAGVDASETLIARFTPDRFSVCHGNRGGGAVLHTQSAAIAVVSRIKCLGIARKAVETKVHKTGFESGMFSFLYAVNSLMLGNLVGEGLNGLTCILNLFADGLRVVHICTDDIVIGHDQTITAAEWVEIG